MSSSTDIRPRLIDKALVDDRAAGVVRVNPFQFGVAQPLFLPPIDCRCVALVEKEDGEPARKADDAPLLSAV